MKNKHTGFKQIYIYFLLHILIVAGCKKFVEVDPPSSQIVSESVFTNDATAISAISGIYSEMIKLNSGFSSGDLNSVTYLAALSADEAIPTGNVLPETSQFYENTLIVQNSSVKGSLWEMAYKITWYANSTLEGLQKSTGVTPVTKKQIEGEAKFLRAFCHFYLVNLFGNCPLITSTSYKTNQIASRADKTIVYQQIIADLLDAQNSLSDDYSLFNDERVRVNKWAATALLARVYLFNREWSKAEAQSSLLISNTGLFTLNTDLNNVFLKNNQEAIWQLQPVEPDKTANEVYSFLATTNVGNSVLQAGLVNAFETGDARKTNWVNSVVSQGNTYYAAHKYKAVSPPEFTEYSTVLRLAEQYLVRAEARAQQDNIAGARNDVNAIRLRAGLGNTLANDQPSLLLAIEQERRVELFAEWGHRWLDLKRWNKADAVLATLKAPNWQSTDTLYPIPKSEIDNNSNLVQNSGY